MSFEATMFQRQAGRLVIRGGLALTDARAIPTRVDVALERNRIGTVAPKIELREGDKELDARGQLIIPGLINAHTHSHNTFSKGAFDGLPLEIWAQFMGARVVNQSPRETYVGAAISAIEMAKSGTTCACEMTQVSPYPTLDHLDAVVQAYVDVGIRLSFAPQIFDLTIDRWLPGLRERLPLGVARGLRDSPRYPINMVIDLIRTAARRWNRRAPGMVLVGIGPSLLTRCSDTLLERCAELAQTEEMPIQMHLSETRSAAIGARATHGVTETERLNQIGLLTSRTVLAHGIWLDRAEIDLIASSGSSIAHNPISNLKLGAGVADLTAFRLSRCNVALGTDGSASSDSQNMFGPLRLAAILHRHSERNYELWASAQDVLEMATANGARAAGFGSDLGSIREGALADLALLDMSAPAFHPLNNVASQLVHAETGASVRTVIVDGRIVVKDRQLTRIDEGALLAEADEVGTEIRRTEDQTMARRLAPLIRDALKQLAWASFIFLGPLGGAVA